MRNWLWTTVRALPLNAALIVLGGNVFGAQGLGLLCLLAGLWGSALVAYVAYGRLRRSPIVPLAGAVLSAGAAGLGLALRWPVAQVVVASASLVGALSIVAVDAASRGRPSGG